jgi:hypothetical protein
MSHREHLSRPGYMTAAPILARKRIHRIHRTSGAFLGVFLVLHIVNHVVALRSIEAHQVFMAVARIVYRWPPIEVLLLVSVGLQVVTGAVQLRETWNHRAGFWPRLQVYSGAYMLLFLTVHPTAIFAIRYVFHLDSNFYAAAAVLVTTPLLYAPYYALGIGATFAHVACALRGRARTATALAGVCAAVVIVAAFSGAFYEVRLPKPYSDAIGTFGIQ